MPNFHLPNSSCVHITLLLLLAVLCNCMSHWYDLYSSFLKEYYLWSCWFYSWIILLHSNLRSHKRPRHNSLFGFSYGLTVEEIESLPQIDTSKTLIQEVCPPYLSNVECHPGKYRRLDGLCNNIENPSWGATMTPFTRYALLLQAISHAFILGNE